MQKTTKALLIHHSGASRVLIPECLMPADVSKVATKRQMVGSPLENLVELSGRTCYDSLGVGRPTCEYFKHVLEVNHTSILEHATLSFLCYNPCYAGLLSRKGVYFEAIDSEFCLVTINARAMLEWERYSLKGTNAFTVSVRHWCLSIGKDFLYHFKEIMPQIFGENTDRTIATTDVSMVNPIGEEHFHVSMFLIGSRGFTHELVRHRKAMSQRSTRYVDESESNWVEHPLITEFLGCSKYKKLSCVEKAIESGKDCYKTLVPYLEKFLIERGVTPVAARKQARGAARGYLGNALETQIIFTDSIAGWKDMLRQRLNNAADAEIRGVFAEVLEEFKGNSAVQNYFQDSCWNVTPSSDGIGVCLV